MERFISIQNLKKSFGDLLVLDGVNLEISEGEVVSIIGSSGSGKSTLLRCITKLEQADSGSIEIEGKDILQMSRSDFKPILIKMGMVFQSFNLFPHMTVVKNITKSPVLIKGEDKNKVEERAIELLRKVGLEEKANEYPATLSGGQAQRVAIARALCMEPQILLFDEPTSALDPETVGDVLEVIGKLAHEGRTMMIVTHQLEFARQISDRVIFLDGGKIIEEGTPEQIFLNPQNERTKQFILKGFKESYKKQDDIEKYGGKGCEE